MRLLKIRALKDEELEALLLADAKGMEQQEAAKLMNVSRSTFSRMRGRPWRRPSKRARPSRSGAATSASFPTSRTIQKKRNLKNEDGTEYGECRRARRVLRTWRRRRRRQAPSASRPLLRWSSFPRSDFARRRSGDRTVGTADCDLPGPARGVSAAISPKTINLRAVRSGGDAMPRCQSSAFIRICKIVISSNV